MLARVSTFVLAIAALIAQSPNPVTFTLSADPPKAAPGKPARLKLEAMIEKGWHLYSISSPVVPTATRITLAEGTPAKITRILQQKVAAKFDPAADATTESYEDKAIFYIDLAIADDAKPGAAEIAVSLRSSACNDKICLPPKRRALTAKIDIDPQAPPAALHIPDGFVEGVPAGAASAAPKKIAESKKPVEESLWAFLLTAFATGLASVLTPCVFPMIPFTLSYFINRGEAGRGEGLRQAAVFCLGIVVLFTAIGLTASAVLGGSGAQQLSANPWVNGVIGLVFFAFGLSMLGAFEITIPSGVLTKLNEASAGGGYGGSLLMGLTFSLTSFACVGPFMGSLLAASVTGDRLQPALGMASFASGLALPFFVLALFPAWLKKLPKSGGWLMRVKVVLAFFVFAMMIKYISNVDAVLHWNLISRELFLALWTILVAMPGLYLLGWLRFEGISKDEDVSIPRLLLGIVLLALALLLLAGLFGAPLGEIDGYVPASTRPAGTSGAASMTFMKNDLPGALAKAKAEGKQVFVNFTGYTCTNCKVMKATMFTRAAVSDEMDKMIRVELYTDGDDKDSEANQKLQESKFGRPSIPFYVIMDADGNPLRTFEGLTRDEAEYLKFLRG
ncbi:MAG: DUF255 domain-containing protein [Acidobacteria bacterium]|nr:DUF255 domain-containing protein [Acidobacteriota bacterium]